MSKINVPIFSIRTYCVPHVTFVKVDFSNSGYILLNLRRAYANYLCIMVLDATYYVVLMQQTEQSFAIACMFAEWLWATFAVCVFVLFGRAEKAAKKW